MIHIGSSFLNSAKEFIDLWHSIQTLIQRYKLRGVPYGGNHDKIMEVYQSLGIKFDFLIGAFNSNPILSFASCKQLGTYNVCVVLPKSHSLAKKKNFQLRIYIMKNFYVSVVGIV